MNGAPAPLAGWRWALALGLLVAAAALLGQATPLQRLDLELRDWQRAQASGPRDLTGVLVVDVDEASMAALQSQLGAWPYSRSIYALVHDYLVRNGAVAISYDILFAEPRDADGDAVFAAALAAAPRGVLAAVLSSAPLADPGVEASLRGALGPIRAAGLAGAPGVLLPLPDFGGAARAGTITVVPDADGRLRRVPLAHQVRGHTLPSLPTAALAMAEGRLELDIDAHSRAARLNGRRLPAHADGSVIPEFPANLRALPVQPFHRLVLAALGADGYEIPPAQIRGRTVFVGSSSAVLGDYVLVPRHGRVPGVALQALTYLALRDSRTWREAGAAAGAGLALLTLVPALLFGRGVRRSPQRAGVALGAGLLLALAVQTTALLVLREQAPLAPALLAALFGGILAMGVHGWAQAREREQLTLQALAAQEASALKGRFLAHMTHELRTPLTAIIGYNRLLAAASDPAERSQHGAVIDRSAQHLLGLINNILDQAKLEAGQMRLDLQPVDLRQLLADVATLLKPLADKKGLALAVQVDAAVPARLQLDPLRVRQVLINLVGNALKFTARGGVSVGARWQAGRLALAVRDTGAGIPRAALERIFTAFQQASVSVAAEFGGTGLGLSISKNLAQLMGGGISVESTPGQGSEFTATIAADAAAATQPEPAIRPPPGDPALRGRVLLADDNPDNRALVTLYLKRAGLEVLTAGDGRAALELAQREQPDAVLMDLLMPEMDGLAATRALRAAGYDRPILALTAHTDAAEQQAARAAGCNAVLVKPISPEALRAALAGRLGKAPTGLPG